MYEMTAAERIERTRLKALHAKIREGMKEAAYKGQTFLPLGWPTTSAVSHRYMLLLWGYVRGFPYRRIERGHRIQTLLTAEERVAHKASTYEHNLPSAIILHGIIEHFTGALNHDALKAWLADPAGAIPAPPPRAKKPYVKPAPDPIDAQVAELEKLDAEIEAHAEAEAAEPTILRRRKTS